MYTRWKPPGFKGAVEHKQLIFNVFTHLKPLVYTLGVELVITGQDPEELARLEVTHTYHTPVR